MDQVTWAETRSPPIHLEYTRPELYPGQLAAIFDPHRYSLIEASTKAGKAQPLDALVYTPAGPRRMGDLELGDFVLTPQGSARIVATHPQDGQREVLRITFSDGSVVETDADHLWEVHEFKKPPKVVTTEHLQTWKPWRLRRTWVPKIQAAQFDRQQVPIDPYLVGVLIGDGTLSGETVKLSSADPEILQAVSSALPAGMTMRHDGGYDWHLTAGSQHAPVMREAGTHLRSQLTGLGLTGTRSDTKFIPDCYRYNTVAVRMGVLRGLLDTDGFVDKYGQPAIEQTSQRLAADIEEVVQSLGGTVLTRLRPMNGYKDATGRFIQCKPVYRQSIRAPDGAALFSLERKRSLCRPKRKTGNRMFRSVEFSRYAPTRCIELDDDRQLYLTNGFVPTHNTAGCICWIVEQALAGQEGWNYWWVAPVSGQADIAFRRTLRALPPGYGQANLTLKTITLLNGTVIWFKSGDKPDSLYGDDVYAAVVDEASRLKQDAWFAVRSTLTFTQGPVRIIGNVKGRKNWFYQLARRAEQSLGDPNSAMGYHKLTAYDAISAGVLTTEDVEDARNILPEHVFRELYLAEAADDDTNPFGLKAIQACVAPLSMRPVAVWGIDLAKKRDWTVALGLDLEGYTAGYSRFQVSWDMTMARIRDLVRFTPALVDATGVGDPIVELLQKSSPGTYEGYVFTPASKQRLMEGLAVAIQSHQVHYPQEVVDELENFEFEYTKFGVRYSAPEGFHDDKVMALALANQHRTHAKLPLVISDEVLARSSLHG